MNHRRLLSVALDVSVGAVAYIANLVFLVFDLSVALLGCIAKLALAAVLVCVAYARSLASVLNAVNLRFLAHRVCVALVAAVASVPGCIEYSSGAWCPGPRPYRLSAVACGGLEWRLIGCCSFSQP